MVTADIAENDLVKLLKEFDIFERNKVSLEIKLTAIAMYLLSKLEELLYSLTLVNQLFITGLRNSRMFLNLMAKKRSERL